MLNLINLFHIKLSIILYHFFLTLFQISIRYIHFYDNWKFMLHSYCFIHYAKEFFSQFIFPMNKTTKTSANTIGFIVFFYPVSTPHCHSGFSWYPYIFHMLVFAFLISILCLFYHRCFCNIQQKHTFESFKVLMLHVVADVQCHHWRKYKGVCIVI